MTQVSENNCLEESFKSQSPLTPQINFKYTNFKAVTITYLMSRKELKRVKSLHGKLMKGIHKEDE